MFIARVVLATHEKGLVFVDGQFTRLLAPGVHWILEPWRSVVLRRVSLLSPHLEFADTEFLVREPAVAAEVETHRIKDTERGLMFRDGKFEGFLKPGFHAFFRTPSAFKVDIVDIQQLEVSHPLRDVLTRAPGSGQFLQLVDVADGHRALLLADSVALRMLDPGRYVFWDGLKTVKAVSVDVREQILEIQGQELMTQDKVTVRINLSVRYQVVEAEKALTSQTSFKDALYREVQLALRDEVGGRTLDALLERKEDLGTVIVTRVQEAVGGFGVVVKSAGLRDLILPGEMRTILNQVIEAEKRAAANMIARREETAATRNLMNTAKLLENNPTLMRLKELETVEKVAEKIGTLSVYGGLDGLMDALKGFARPGAKSGSKGD